MLKTAWLVLIAVCLSTITLAQTALTDGNEPDAKRMYNKSYWEIYSSNPIDSLRSAFESTGNDTLRMGIGRRISYYYIETNPDSAIYFCDSSLEIARKLDLKLWQADGLDNLGYLWGQKQNYPRSFRYFLEALHIGENKETAKNVWHPNHFISSGDPEDARLMALGFIYNDLGTLYVSTGNLGKALSNTLEATRIGNLIDEQSLLSITNMNLGNIYLNLNKADSALHFAQLSLQYTLSCGFRKYMGALLTTLGNIYFKKGDNNTAKQYYTQAYQESQRQNNLADLGQASISLSDVYRLTGNMDSSMWYAKNGRNILETLGAPDGLFSAYSSLSKIYAQGNVIDSAYFYQGLAMAAKDSMNSVEKINQFTNLGLDEQIRLQELEQEQVQLQNKIRTYAMLSGIFLSLIVALFLYRNSRVRQKANTLLQKQKESIEQKNTELASTLTQLKSTQSQLIQSEKMASLGELTAGIAHEIQNPLNFVNNFSEVNSELIIELEEAANIGNLDEVKAIAQDLKANEEKIKHHGKRADSIVKGMLQHSQKGSGVKEPTNINLLADEHLRLAYHGLKAKDKSFNALIKTDFDESIGNVNIIPQDIGRVLLNLINNALYAVGEKEKQFGDGYEPMVTVSTRLVSDLKNQSISKLANELMISVADNGNGISESNRNKIFQPFFTTKPTGEGTGLGLSLSYDIVKAHGGEIRVESKEGEGTQFSIQLPI